MPAWNDSQAQHKSNFCSGIFKTHTHTQLQINIAEPPHFWSNVGISHHGGVSVTIAFMARFFWCKSQGAIMLLAFWSDTNPRALQMAFTVRGYIEHFPVEFVHLTCKLIYDFKCLTTYREIYIFNHVSMFMFMWLCKEVSFSTAHYAIVGCNESLQLSYNYFVTFFSYIQYCVCVGYANFNLWLRWADRFPSFSVWINFALLHLELYLSYTLWPFLHSPVLCRYSALFFWGFFFA